MRVSIIIPAYNAKNTIKEAVDSVLNQDFFKRDFEIIVINDGSTDNTLKVLKTYGKRIKIINQKNHGAVKAANRGFREAQGEYIIKLDSDDHFKPGILKEMVAILDKKSKIDFVYCDYYEKGLKGNIKIISTKNIFNTISEGIMFKKNKLTKQGFYNQKIKFAEYDLLLKTQKKWQGFHITKPLFCYNRHSESLTGDKQWVEVAMRELKENHPSKIKEIKKIREY